MLVDQAGKSSVDSFHSLMYLIKHRVYELNRNAMGALDIALIHSHFGGYEPAFLPTSFIAGLIEEFKTVIPIRDPLLALITKRARSHQDAGFHIVSGFHLLAVAEFDSFYFPLDLYLHKSVQERESKISQLFAYIGIPIEDEILSHWKELPVIGSTDNAANQEKAAMIQKMKEYYYDGNLEKIIEQIPGEYRYLKSIEHQVRPFLEKLGYTGLLWWD